MATKILPIVEGEGDERAVPELLRRILHAHDFFDVQVLRPHRRGDLPKVKANFTRFFQTAILENAAVLCVLDFDCEFCQDVVAEEAELRSMANQVHANYPFEACFIVKEFESLFLWDAETARLALPKIPDNVQFPDNPESIRDAKGWLSCALPPGMAYKPIAHQAKLAALVNLDTLREQAPSFSRLENAVLRLLNHDDPA